MSGEIGTVRARVQVDDSAVRALAALRERAGEAAEAMDVAKAKAARWLVRRARARRAEGDAS